MTTIDKATLLLAIYSDRNGESDIDEEIQLHYNLRIAQLKFFLYFGDSEVTEGTINNLYEQQVM